MNASSKVTSTKLPTPLYAVAGAGDLAYEQLRKLPAKVVELRGRVAELRPAAPAARVDLDRLRTVARRNATAVVTGAVSGAQVAQERAVAVYGTLVARGEKVVLSARTETANEIAEVADTVKPIEAKIDEVAAEIADPQETLPSVPDKAARRARPAAKK
jgi:malate/lactate dehydrogenase